jgi:hypothetical protein
MIKPLKKLGTERQYLNLKTVYDILIQFRSCDFIQRNKEKEKIGIKIGKVKIKLSLFANDMIP